MRINIDPDDYEDLADDLSSWRPHQILRLVKGIDERMGEWDLVLELKAWADAEAAKHTQEVAEDAARRGLCHPLPLSEKTVHQTPHKGCVLR
jgi:hypothetical protein